MSIIGYITTHTHNIKGIIMKDVLQDIIQHTLGIGVIDLVKINGTTSETNLSAVAEDRTVILNCKFKNPIAGFDGVFGMPALSKLKTILSFSDEYDENANISVLTTTRDGINQPSTIHFENKSGDFVNDYRLMAKEIVEEKVKNVVFKGATWSINFQPTVHGIGRLKKQAQVNSEQIVFSTKFVNGDLQVNIGDPSSTSGNFIFHPKPTGIMNNELKWPVRQFLSIMDLPGDKQVFISDQGVMKITVDSGQADYEYLLPACN